MPSATTAVMDGGGQLIVRVTLGEQASAVDQDGVERTVLETGLGGGPVGHRSRLDRHALRLAGLHDQRAEVGRLRTRAGPGSNVGVPSPAVRTEEDEAGQDEERDARSRS